MCRFVRSLRRCSPLVAMGVLALAGVATALPAAELSVNDFCFDGPLGSTRAPS